MDFFPNSYRIHLLDKETRMPVRNIAIELTIFATRKNNYHMVPNISDDNGDISFSKGWLSEEIEKEANLFIMDYACRLQDCLPKIKILVMSVEDVSRVIEGRELFKDYFSYASEDIERLSKVDNKNYNSYAKEIILSGEEKINILVELERQQD